MLCNAFVDVLIDCLALWQKLNVHNTPHVKKAIKITFTLDLNHLAFLGFADVALFQSRLCLLIFHTQVFCNDYPYSFAPKASLFAIIQTVSQQLRTFCLTISMFTSFLLVEGLLLLRSSSIFSLPSLNPLCHLKTQADLKCECKANLKCYLLQSHKLNFWFPKNSNTFLINKI